MDTTEKRTGNAKPSDKAQRQKKKEGGFLDWLKLAAYLAWLALINKDRR